MRIAHVENDIVVNISLGESGIDGTHANIGDLYDGVTFSKPPRDLAKEKADKIERLKQKRIAVAEGGMLFGGKLVPTDKEAILLVESAIKYMDGKAGKKVKRAGLGEIDKQTLDAYFEATGAKHEAAFARESDLFDLVMAATTVEELDAIDIEAGW